MFALQPQTSHSKLYSMLILWSKSVACLRECSMYVHRGVRTQMCMPMGVLIHIYQILVMFSGQWNKKRSLTTEDTRSQTITLSKICIILRWSCRYSSSPPFTPDDTQHEAKQSFEQNQHKAICSKSLIKPLTSFSHLSCKKLWSMNRCRYKTGEAWIQFHELKTYLAVLPLPASHFAGLCQCNCLWKICWRSLRTNQGLPHTSLYQSASSPTIWSVFTMYPNTFMVL